MTKNVSLIADLIERLDVDRRYEFDERAGTIEFDSEQSRDQAELLALVDLLRAHPGALLGIALLQIELDGAKWFVMTTDVDLARQQLRPIDPKCIRTADLASVIRTHFKGMALTSQIA